MSAKIFDSFIFAQIIVCIRDKVWTLNLQQYNGAYEQQQRIYGTKKEKDR